MTAAEDDLADGRACRFGQKPDFLDLFGEIIAPEIELHDHRPFAGSGTPSMGCGNQEAVKHPPIGRVIRRKKRFQQRSAPAGAHRKRRRITRRRFPAGY